MVFNSTNINKANNHLSSYLAEHKKTTTYDAGKPDPGLGQAHTFVGIKPVNGIPIIHS
jgi:hypothetical protein